MSTWIQDPIPGMEWYCRYPDPGRLYFLTPEEIRAHVAARP